MIKIAIVYHSGKGHTKAFAEDIASGITSTADTIPSLISVDDDMHRHWEVLNAADALVFGSPTYMGSVSGEFKSFMDATSNIWFNRGWVNKIAAGFTNSGGLSGDKLSTLHALSTFAAQHGMLWVGQEHICTEFEPKADTVNRLGGYLGLMTQCNPYTPAEESLLPGDRATARLFGKRIGTATLRWKRGLVAA